MKQKGDLYLVAPKQAARTLLGVQKWHRHVMELCLFLEFKQRTLKASLSALNEEIRQYAPFTKDAVLSNPARMALRQLNKVKDEISEDLETVKAAIRIAHDTNESIIGSLLKSSAGQDFAAQFDPYHKPKGTNLLHGTKGWMYEVASANKLIKDGYAAFVTFGTLFDPAGIDVVAVSKPRHRIEFRLPMRKKARRKASKVV